MKQEVYISYAWSGSIVKGKTHSPIIDEICEALTSNNFNPIIDKKTIRYKDNIKKFEERLGNGDKIILVVSDKFLRSPHCMYEVLKIKERGNISERIFPIILNDAKIYSAGDRLNYIKYWENEIEKLNTKIKKLKSQANITGTSKTIDNYTSFRSIIDEILTVLSEMNTLSPELHRESDFSELIKLLKDNKIEISLNDEKLFGQKIANTKHLYEKAIQIVSNEFKSQSIKDSDLLERLNDWYKKCQNQTFHIGVMAMVKSGKSSFLNSLLGNEFLPMSNIPETAVPVRIVHEIKNEPILVVNRSEKLEGATRINDFLKNRNKSQRDKGALKQDEITLHASIIALEEQKMSQIKFEILDTPGFGEALHSEVIGKSIEENTNDLLEKISVVIYILDYTKLKTDQEKLIMTKFSDRPDILEKIQDRLFFIVNKMDEQDRNGLTPEQTVDYVYDLIKPSMPLLSKKQIFQVSAKKALLSRLILQDNATEKAREDFGTIAFGAMATEMEEDKYKVAARKLLESSKINIIESQLIDFIYKERGRLFIETLLDNLKRLLIEFKNKFVLTPQGALKITVSEIEALEIKIGEAKKKQESIEKEAEKFENQIKEWIEDEFKQFEKKILDDIESLFDTKKALHKQNVLNKTLSRWVISLHDKIHAVFNTAPDNSINSIRNRIVKLNKEILNELNNEFVEFKKRLERRIYEKQKDLLSALELTINSLAREFESTLKKALNITLETIKLELTDAVDMNRLQSEANASIDRFVDSNHIVKNVQVPKEVYIEAGWCRKGRYETRLHWQQIQTTGYNVSKESIELFWRDCMEKMSSDAKNIANKFIEQQIKREIRNARKKFNDYTDEYLISIQSEKIRKSSDDIEVVKARISELQRLNINISEIIVEVENFIQID